METIAKQKAQITELQQMQAENSAVQVSFIAPIIFLLFFAIFFYGVSFATLMGTLGKFSG